MLERRPAGGRPWAESLANCLRCARFNRGLRAWPLRGLLGVTGAGGDSGGVAGGPAPPILMSGMRAGRRLKTIARGDKGRGEKFAPRQ